MIREWCEYMIGKALVEYFPPMKTCNKFTINMRPDIKYSRKMSEKSKSWFLTMKTEDPASNSGIISLFKGCVPYLPVIDDRHQKTPMFGDQGFFEWGHNVSFSRSGEENLVERLDGFVSIPQEWHKKKEDLLIYNKLYNLPNQTALPGTLQNIKNRFHHHKASKDITNFYACWDLMEVTTLSNLVALASEVSGLGLDTEDANITENAFKQIVSEVYARIDGLGKWLPAGSDHRGEVQPRVANGGGQSGHETQTTLENGSDRSSRNGVNVDFQSWLQGRTESQSGHQGREEYQPMLQDGTEQTDGHGEYQPRLHGHSESQSGPQGNEEYQLMVQDSTEQTDGRGEYQSRFQSCSESQSRPQDSEEYQPRSQGSTDHQSESEPQGNGEYQSRLQGPTESQSRPQGNGEYQQRLQGRTESQSRPLGSGGVGQHDQIEAEQDEMYNFHCDMLFSGVVQCAQKAATQHGACQALIAFWKNSMGLYHENGKIKYRKAAHMKLASASGVLGEKVMMDSIFNCLVNDQGLPNTNVEGDLKVEHQNLQFKTGLQNLAGNYTDQSIQRVAKAMNLTKELREKLVPQYKDSEEAVRKEVLGHRRADWSQQLRIVVEDIQSAAVYSRRPGRKMPGAPGFQRKVEFDFKGMNRFLKKYSKELDLYVEATFQSR